MEDLDAEIREGVITGPGLYESLAVSEGRTFYFGSEGIVPNIWIEIYSNTGIIGSTETKTTPQVVNCSTLRTRRTQNRAFLWHLYKQ